MPITSENQVNPEDLYDGPVPSNVEHFPEPPVRRPIAFTAPPEERVDPRTQPDYVATITAALDVLGARLLGLISTVAACAMWGGAVYDPELLRTYAAIGFSLTVLLPIVVLYWRRG